MHHRGLTSKLMRQTCLLVGMHPNILTRVHKSASRWHGGTSRKPDVHGGTYLLVTGHWALVTRPENLTQKQA